MGPEPGVRQPTNHTSAEGPQQDQRGQSGSNRDSTPLANAGLVPAPPADGNNAATPSAQTKGPLSPRRELPSRGAEPGVAIRRLEAIRQTERAKDLSPSALALINNSWRRSTSKNYDSAWSRWSEWTKQHELDERSPSPQQVANYLAEMFEQGVSYASLANARSAISQTVDSPQPLGESWQVTRVMKGAAARKPPLPRYNEAWDLDLLINWVVGLKPDNLERKRTRALVLLMIELIA